MASDRMVKEKAAACGMKLDAWKSAVKKLQPVLGATAETGVEIAANLAKSGGEETGRIINAMVEIGTPKKDDKK